MRGKLLKTSERGAEEADVLEFSEDGGRQEIPPPVVQLIIVLDARIGAIWSTSFKITATLEHQRLPNGHHLRLRNHHKKKRSTTWTQVLSQFATIGCINLH